MTDRTPVSKKEKKKDLGKDYVRFKKRRELWFVKGFIGRSMLRIHGENDKHGGYFTLYPISFSRFQ